MANVNTKTKVLTGFTGFYDMVITIATAMGGYILFFQAGTIYKVVAGAIAIEAARRMVRAFNKRTM